MPSNSEPHRPLARRALSGRASLVASLLASAGLHAMGLAAAGWLGAFVVDAAPGRAGGDATISVRLAPLARLGEARPLARPWREAWAAAALRTPEPPLEPASALAALGSASFDPSTFASISAASASLPLAAVALPPLPEPSALAPAAHEPPAPALAERPAVRMELAAEGGLGLRIEPRFPERCRRQRHAGTALLELRLAAGWRIAEARVLQSAGCPELDSAALAAARHASFTPPAGAGTSPEESAGLVLRLPIRFQL